MHYRGFYPASLSSVASARRAVADCARMCGFDSAAVADIESATGEALANAAEHGTGAIEVMCYAEAGTLVVEVADEGPGFGRCGFEELRGAPNPESARGFGIFIMRELMDSVEYRERGRKVRLTKRLPACATDCGAKRA